MQISVETTGIDQVIKALNYLGKNTPVALRQWAMRLLLRVKATAIQNVSNDILNVRTGTLRRWISYQDVVDEGNGVCSWGLPKNFGPSVYGAKLEEGGDITAQPGRLLRVPLPAALTGNGVDRYAGISFRDSGLPPGLSVISRPGHTPLIVKIIEKIKNARWELWYALVPKVTIQKHPWFSNAVTAATETGSPEQSLVSALQELLNGQ